MQLELRNIRDQNRTLSLQNDKMTGQIDAFQFDPRMLEKVAREELGMIRSNEIVYLFPHAGPNDFPSTKSEQIADATR